MLVIMNVWNTVHLCDCVILYADFNKPLKNGSYLSFYFHRNITLYVSLIIINLIPYDDTIILDNGLTQSGRLAII